MATITDKEPTSDTKGKSKQTKTDATLGKENWNNQLPLPQQCDGKASQDPLSTTIRQYDN